MATVERASQPVSDAVPPRPARGWFEAPPEQYAALRGGVAIVDRSDRGKLALTGPDAVEFLHGQVTNDIKGLVPGTGCYAAFLTPKGMMLGDLRVLAVGGNEAEVERGPSDQVVELLLDTERITLQRLFDMIRRFKIGYRVELHKRTLERCLVRLAGPGARAFLAGLAPALGSLPSDEWSHLSGEVEGVSVRAIACEDGEVELLCEAGERERLVRALAAAGAVEVSQDSFEVVRVERGIPRYGYDLDDRTIPQEAGLNERAVSFTKGCYVGQETVARLYYKGKPNRHLRGLALERPAPIGTTLFRGDREVGRLGSVALSPTYGPIALAILRRECEEGDRLAVGQRGEYGSALVKQPRFQPQEVAVEG